MICERVVSFDSCYLITVFRVPHYFKSTRCNEFRGTIRGHNKVIERNYFVSEKYHSTKNISFEWCIQIDVIDIRSVVIPSSIPSVLELLIFFIGKDLNDYTALKNSCSKFGWVSQWCVFSSNEKLSFKFECTKEWQIVRTLYCSLKRVP